MSRKIILSADSTCDLGKELQEKHQVHYYPFHIVLEEKDYLIRTKELIRGQRKGLKEGITSLGWRVYGSKANFVFFRAPGQGNLKVRLEEKGILIRGCGNYPGLDESYYRVAVRSPRENQMLLAALKEQAQN